MQLNSGLNRFQLRLVGYQFPHIANENYDSNWLVVEGSVKHAGGEWTFRDPCLLTWEAWELLMWLDTLSSGQPTKAELHFLEPNISFLSRPGGILCVSFSLEALPPQSQLVDGIEDEFVLSFALDADSLRQAAQDLRMQLTQFPRRAVQ
jgi:hypothetical protein